MEAMRPFLHEMQLSGRSLDDRSKEWTLKLDTDYQLDIEYYKRDEGTAENILRIFDLKIPARSEVVIHFGVSKSLIQFEKYPNDPSRGFNVMQMPVLYQEVIPGTL